MVNKKISNQIKKNFLELAVIPSPSGMEKQVGGYISEHMKKNGWKTYVDRSGRLNNSNYGNIVTSLDKNGTKKMLFVAHMDTVQKPNELIKPIFTNGVFKSSGNTILGADNKASVAVLLTLSQQPSLKHAMNRIALAFTTREEDGQMGSKYLDVNLIKPDYIVNIDGSSPVGTVDRRSMGQLIFEINVYGKAAHAATEPWKGIHAIKVGAKIINTLRMGTLPDGTTLNIGTIQGGQSTNIIPDKCFLKGEIRSFSEEKIKQQYDKLTNTANLVADKLKSSCLIKTVVYIPPFIGKNNQQIIREVKKITKELSIKYQEQDASYTSDSSYLSQTNLPTITICKGGRHPHSAKENINLSEMENLYSILEKMILNIK